MFERKKLVVAAVAAMALVGLSACSSDDTESAVDSVTGSAAAAVSSATSAVESAVDSADAPDAETLQETLTVVTDPAASSADKAAVVTDGDAKIATLDAFGPALANYPLTFEVGEITTEGESASAPVTVTGPHGGAPIPMTWDNVDGDWKLSTVSFCGLAAMGQVIC